MNTYWVTGRMFADDHSRAIRYVDQVLAINKLKSPDFPKDKKVTIEYCDKCNAFHLVRPVSVLK